MTEVISILVDEVDIDSLRIKNNLQHENIIMCIANRLIKMFN
jgi:hypothetical protein